MLGLVAAAAMLMTVTLPPIAHTGNASEPDTVAGFTPLDEIERVRQTGCGIQDFEEFLGWYVSSTTSGGWLEQVIWTNYMVKIGALADPEGPGNWVDRQDYLGQFRITSSDYRSTRENAAVTPDSPNRRVTLTRLGDRQYRVDWRGGVPFAGVEGADRDKQSGAYIFEYRKDCWYLTGDLR